MAYIQLNVSDVIRACDITLEVVSKDMDEYMKKAIIKAEMSITKKWYQIWKSSGKPTPEAIFQKYQSDNFYEEDGKTRYKPGGYLYNVAYSTLTIRDKVTSIRNEAIVANSYGSYILLSPDDIIYIRSALEMLHVIA
jgi:hypothetical protein